MPADPARAHVRALAEAGIGWKRAAELAGISTGAMSKLLYGGPGNRPPTQRVRPETAAAILAVKPEQEALAPAALTDATGTHRRVQALAAAGWSQSKIGQRLGMSPANFATMMRRQQVTAATAAAARAVYDELWKQPPPETGHREKIAAARARNHARAAGWAPPLAWDDDVIDLPDGKPAEGWQRSSRTTRAAAELAEDAAELAAQGYTPEHSAGRLGVSRAALDKAVSRAREATEREHDAQRARFAAASRRQLPGSRERQAEMTSEEQLRQAESDAAAGEVGATWAAAGRAWQAAREGNGTAEFAREVETDAQEMQRDYAERFGWRKSPIAERARAREADREAGG